MRKKSSSILFVRENAYRLGNAGTIGSPHATLQAALMNDATGGPITIALPSYGCLTAPIDLHHLPRARRQAMLYRLEEQLPMPIEEIVADYIESPASALGVVGQLRHLRPIVAAVEEAGLTIACIAPLALLAAQSYLAEPAVASGDALLFSADDLLELFELRDRRITAWITLAVNEESAARELQVMALRRKIGVTCINVDEQIIDRLRGLTDVVVTTATAPPADAAAALTAQSVAAKRLAPFIELWRYPLGSAGAFRGDRRPVIAAVAAAVLLSVAMFVAILSRAGAYDRLAADEEQQQQAIFKSEFPDKSFNDALPASTQLLREERRLRGLAGAGDAAVPPRVSSLTLLQRVLAALPPDGRCDVSDLQIKDDQVSIEAVVPTHADASAIAAALSVDHGFVVDPPRTEQLAGSTNVAMTLNAALSPARGAQR